MKLLAAILHLGNVNFEGESAQVSVPSAVCKNVCYKDYQLLNAKMSTRYKLTGSGPVTCHWHHFLLDNIILNIVYSMKVSI